MTSTAAGGTTPTGPAERLGLKPGMVVQELGWDSDTDDELRIAIEDAIDADMVDGDYGNVVDAVLLWWRDEDGDLVDDLGDALADAAGVPTVTAAVEKSTLRSGVRHTGWPLVRWTRRLRPDPLARLHLGDEAVVEVTGLRNPCAQLDKIRPGLMKATLDTDAEGNLIRKAGIMAVVLAGGEVRPGDPIRVELPSGPHRPLETV